MKRKNSIKQYAKALYEATKNAPKHDLSVILNNFLSLLQRDNKLKKVEYIIDEFVRYSKKAEGISEIEIESARKLDTATVEKIKKAFGGKSEVSETINKDLIGGLRIRMDDLIFDASIKKQISRLKQDLIK